MIRKPGFTAVTSNLARGRSSGFGTFRVFQTLEAIVDVQVVRIVKPENLNVIVGQAHFIKTVEDIHEALAGVGGALRFGAAFCEASGRAWCAARATTRP